MNPVVYYALTIGCADDKLPTDSDYVPDNCLEESSVVPQMFSHIYSIYASGLYTICSTISNIV